MPVRVDNTLIRKEFGSISNYLIKALGTQHALFDVLVEKKIDQRGKIHSVRVENATSKEIDRIDSSIIEDVKCEFSVDAIFDRKTKIKAPHTPRTFDELIGDLLGNKTDENNPTSEVFMERAFKFKDAKHHFQLKYLSDKHLGKIFKLRFTVSPFAFLFLVEGKQKFFFVFETFNDELATYIWECEKNKDTLKTKFKEVENLMASFEETNRQKYLETEPNGFYRIYHNYINEVDGFNRWKDDFEKILMA